MNGSHVNRITECSDMKITELAPPWPHWAETSVTFQDSPCRSELVQFSYKENFTQSLIVLEISLLNLSLEVIFCPENPCIIILTFKLPFNNKLNPRINLIFLSF